jgi:hypothetical protein
VSLCLIHLIDFKAGVLKLVKMAALKKWAKDGLEEIFGDFATMNPKQLLLQGINLCKYFFDTLQLNCDDCAVLKGFNLPVPF